MPVDPLRKSPMGDPESDLVACPLCQGNLLRHPRRTVDRMRSLFAPVKRYRCDNFACQWEGNISSRRSVLRSTNTAGDQPVADDAHGRPNDVPVAFIVHMVLVAVGVVLVVVFSTMEPTWWNSEEVDAIESIFYPPVPERSADRTSLR